MVDVVQSWPVNWLHMIIQVPTVPVVCHCQLALHWDFLQLAWWTHLLGLGLHWKHLRVMSCNRIPWVFLVLRVLKLDWIQWLLNLTLVRWYCWIQAWFTRLLLVTERSGRLKKLLARDEGRIWNHYRGGYRVILLLRLVKLRFIVSSWHWLRNHNGGMGMDHCLSHWRSALIVANRIILAGSDWWWGGGGCAALARRGLSVEAEHRC